MSQNQIPPPAAADSQQPIRKNKEKTNKKKAAEIHYPVYIDSDYILPSDYTKEQQEKFFHHAHAHALATKVGDEKAIKDKRGQRIFYPCGCRGWNPEGKPVCEHSLPISCECCGRYVAKETLDWRSCKPTDLDFLGSGIPLFFEFIKYCGYFLIILLLSGGSYNFFSNALHPDCKEPSADGEVENHCNLNWISRFSLADKRHDGPLNDLQAILNLFSIFALIVLLQIFRTSQRVINEETDNGDLSPCDYAILIKDLPRDEASLSREALAESLNKSFGDAPVTFKVADEYGDLVNTTKLFKDLPQQEQVLPERINLSYDTKELDELKAYKATFVLEYQNALKAFYAKGEEHGTSKLEGEDEYIAKIQSVERGDIEQGAQQKKDKRGNCDELEAKFCENHVDVQKKFTGYCFVSFEREQYKDGIVEFFRKKQQLRIEGTDSKETKPKVFAATDPTDVFWENLKYTLQEKRVRRLISFIINFTTLFLCFLTIFFLSEKQRQLNIEVEPQLLKVCQGSLDKSYTHHDEDFFNKKSTTAAATANMLQNHDHLLIGQTYKSDLLKQQLSAEEEFIDYSKYETEQFKVKIITILISVVIIPVFNAVLLQVMKFTTEYEKYTTKTENQISLATKLSVGLFFNTALQTFITKIVILWNVECLESARQAIFTDGGLIYTQENVLMMNAFQNTLVYLIDATKLTQWGKKWFFMDRVKDKCTLTQKQANELSQEPAYLIAPRYAFIMNTMFTTAFYAPLLPIGMVWSLICLFFTYWIEKYKVLNQRSILHNITNRLSTEMTELLELFLPIYCAANLIFSYMIVKTPSEHPNLHANPFWDMFISGSLYAKVGIFVGIVHSLLPMKELNESWIPTDVAIENNYTYKDAKHRFATTYEKENPATQAGALLKEHIHNKTHH